ncbi:MAG: radical SAM protein [Nodularia sp. (in: Bacteria)]|nr:MAG: radical SAM protein [Nodularia sp. (in: cyanobacteria)]
MTKDFKVLMTAVPRIKYDLTMHYRYTDFGETIGFLKNLPQVHVDVLDGAVMNYLVRDYISKFLENYDLVIFYAETAESKMTLEMADMCKKLSPKTKIAVYGDATLYIPQFFTREPFDAVHVSGDQDIVFANYIQFLCDQSSSLFGLIIKDDSEWKNTEIGQLLASDKWAFPALDLLPIEEYKIFCNIKKVNTFDGSVYVAKGCKYGCAYCVVPRREGLPDRRRPINPLVDYLEVNRDVFDVYQLHAGTFTEDKRWVINFCGEIIKRQVDIRWKCTTRVDCLDEDCIKAMAEAGCKGINIGVESLSKNKTQLTNKVAVAQLENLSKLLDKYQIHSKAYIMIGMPNQSQEDFFFTIKILEELNYSIRPTGYTPFQKLSKLSTEELDQIDLEKWDRKSLFHEEVGFSFREFHEILLLTQTARDTQAEIILDSKNSARKNHVVPAEIDF